VSFVVSSFIACLFIYYASLVPEIQAK